MLLTVPNSPLLNVRGLLIDLDGVVLTGREALPGAASFLAEARRRGLPFLLVTNNSTTSPVHVAERLRAMGIEVEPREILTSADVAAAYVRAASPAGARVLVIGEAGLRDALADQGLELVEDETAADWVVAGLDRAFDYQKLHTATRAIRNGARFLATNADALLPVEGGEVQPGAGSIVAAISTATGTQPVVAGKPEPALFRRGLERLGNLAASEAAMIGDRLDTDVEGGQRAGLRTVLVLTGVTNADHVENTPHPPDAVVPSLAAVAPLMGWEQGDGAS
jgi:4-nitrophenyl phosphatase